MSPALALAAPLLAAYVLVGALDLGIGSLLPLVARGRDRDAILAGGSQPWSVGAAWALLAFALVVAGLPGSLAALRALWPPLALTFLCLLLRGLLSALRPHVLRRDLVDFAFGLASAAAAAFQGLVLGWAVARLDTNIPARHAGSFGALSVWGLLCAAGLIGLSTLIGSGWLIVSGRDAVRVFSREVGRAAAILFAGVLGLCTLWAIWPTVVAASAFARGWASAAPVALFAAGALALLAPFGLSLWGRRPAIPLACASLPALCGLASVAALLATPPPPTDTPGGGASTAYLAFMLLIGSPLVGLCLSRRGIAVARGAPTDTVQEASPHAGRRSGSLANSLHLS